MSQIASFYLIKNNRRQEKSCRRLRDMWAFEAAVRLSSSQP